MSFIIRVRCRQSGHSLDICGSLWLTVTDISRSVPCDSVHRGWHRQLRGQWGGGPAGRVQVAVVAATVRLPHLWGCGVQREVGRDRCSLRQSQQLPVSTHTLHHSRIITHRDIENERARRCERLIMINQKMCARMNVYLSGFVYCIKSF